MSVKEKILVKAKEEFLNNGIRNMSVQSLVVPLGISTKTFYKYFKNKEELLEEVLKTHYSQQFEVIRSYSKEENPVHLLLNIWIRAFNIENDVNNKFYYDLHNYYPRLEKEVETQIGKDFWSEFMSLIEKGKEQGLFEKFLQPAIILESITILYGSAVRTDQYKKFEVSTRDVFLHTIAVLVRGMCTPLGIKAYEEYLTVHLKNN